MYSTITDGVSAELAGARMGYRQEFEEMECRIKKCERQRAELERQFAELMNERAESERAAARAMKQRHKRLMEDERHRAERNESILRMLNKIDQQAASLAAKTDRLKMLKTQYEMYLMRTYSSAQSSYAAYNPPMIAAPPVILAKAPQSPSKSSFAQYLSDLTHQQQQASIEPIPPPTALSNYLAAQQKSSNQVSSSYTAPIERPYSRMWDGDVPQRRPITAGSDVAHVSMANGGAKAKRFDMSNEDFIRYIDSEVLKEPVPTVCVAAPSPEGSNKPTDLRGAYLEDAGMSEDEQRPVAIDRMTVQFDVVAVEDSKKTVAWKEVDGATPVETFEPQKNSSSVALDRAENIQPLLEDSSPTGAASTKELDDASNVKPIAVNEIPSQYHGTEDGYDGIMTDRNDPQELPHVPFSDTTNEQCPVGERLAVDEVKNEVLQYPTSQEDHMYQQQMVYSGEGQESTQDYNDQFHEQYNTGESNEADGSTGVNPAQHDQLPDRQHNTVEYSTEQNPQGNEMSVEAVQLHQPLAEQKMHQPTVGGQGWSTARQAMRSKAFPEMSPKAAPPETNPTEGTTEASFDSIYEGGLTQETVDPTALQGQGYYEGVETNESVDEKEKNTEVYVPETNEQSYYAANTGEEPNADLLQATPAQGYQDDAMGQPVDYQIEPVGEDQKSDMYQYQQPDGQQATYPAGQYAEENSANQEQYQYTEGTDTTIAQYGTQEGYHDPNQPYQYDQNAYYDQQQQGYDGQYYSEDAQQQDQQGQQYYMEDSTQQQQQQEQYDQQDPNQMQQQQQQQQQQEVPADGYQPVPAADQEYYATDAQYEPTAENPLTSAGTDQTAAEVPSMEAAPLTDTDPPKDKPEKKSSNGKPSKTDSKPVKKNGVPTSDTPTKSTVNDESDFDFSSQ